MKPDIGPIRPGSKIVNNEPTEYWFRVRRGRTGSLIDFYRYKTREAAEADRAKLRQRLAP